MAPLRGTRSRFGGRALRLLLAVCLVWLAFPGLAVASPAAKLTYLRGAGAEKCPDEHALREAVAARLGYDVFFPWARRTVVAEISRGARAFRARLQIVSEEGLVLGTRSIDATSDDCVEVVRALALAISIAVDDFGLDDVQPTSTPTPTATPTPTPTPTSSPTSPPDSLAAPSIGLPTSSSLPLFSVSLAALYSFGFAPSSSPGLAVGLDVHTPRLSLGLELRGDAPASGAAPDKGRVETYLLAASLVPCARPRSFLVGCALLTLGDFHESGEAVANPLSASALFASVGARLGFEPALSGRFSLITRVDGVFILTRHVVTLDDIQAFQLPILAVSVGIGARVRF